MDQSLWQETVRTDAYKEGMGSYNRNKKGICSKKEESVPVVERGKRGGQDVHKKTTKKEIHLAVKVTTNSICILCRKEGWKETDGTELPVFE